VIAFKQGIWGVNPTTGAHIEEWNFSFCLLVTLLETKEVYTNRRSKTFLDGFILKIGLKQPLGEPSSPRESQ
jgi:hypothetical protein